MTLKLILMFLLLISLSGCGFKASLSDLISTENPSIDEPGTTPVPTGPLVVEVNQRSTQSDPTTSLPIEFLVEFSDEIIPSEFTTSDLQVTGTASGVNVIISNSGDNKNFAVQVTSVSSPGQIQISIQSGAVVAASGVANSSAVSTDPIVTYQIPSGGAPHMLKNISTDGLGTDLTHLSASINSLYVEYQDSVTVEANIPLSTNTLATNTNHLPNIELIRANSDYLGELGGYHYYFYDDGVHGEELWRSDGTAAGTSLVKDINPGANSAGFVSSNMQNQKKYLLNGYFYFSANIGGLDQLWRSDGTTAGTQMYIDLVPDDSEYESYRILGEFNGRMYFAGKESSTTGQQLHWTDGTSRGFIDIRPGSVDDIDQETMNPFLFKNQIYFKCKNGFKNVLCRLNPNHTFTYITSCAVATDCVEYPNIVGQTQDHLYFSADTVISGVNYGYELWVTDGEPTGNIFLGDLNPSGDSFSLSFKVDFSDLNVFYFMHGVNNTSTLEVWSSDGTPSGTQMLVDLHQAAGWPWEILSDEWYLNGFVIQNKFIFAAQTNASGVELWSTTGTPASTVLLKDIYPGSGHGLETTGYYQGETAALINNKVVFSAKNNSTNSELWVTDGTPGGTQLLKEIYSGTTVGSLPNKFSKVNGRMFFIADSIEYGKEIWETDGTTANTQLYYDVTPGEASSYPWNFISLNNKIYFLADKYNSTELFEYDPSNDQIQIVKKFNSDGNSEVWDLTLFGSELYMTAFDEAENRVGLWKSDGSLAGTELVMPVLGENSGFGKFYKGDTNLYFIGSNDTLSNKRLWKTDGTTTAMVSSTHEYNSNEIGITRGDEILTYTGHSSGKYKIRYSQNGLSIVEHTLNTSVNLDASEFYATTDQFFFIATDDSNDTELYRTDGPTTPTKINLNISGSTQFIPLITVGDEFYFLADIGTGVFLYKANASSVTQIKQVSDVFATTQESYYRFPILYNSKIYFNVNDGVHGYELWVTDGTPSGTQLFKDINTGANGSDPYNMIVHDNKLYFVADDGVHGSEIFESNGTASNTILKYELTSGSSSANPNDFFEHDGKIYFTADDGIHGQELWVMDP